MVAPTQLEGELEQVIADVEAHIRDEQDQLAVGVKAVTNTSPLDSPNTPRPRGKLEPNLAAGGDREAMTAAATALKLFRHAYRQAWERFKELASAVFSGATLLMARRFGMQCEPVDASCWCQLANRRSAFAVGTTSKCTKPGKTA